MVIGGGLTLLIRLPILSLNTWLVLLMALLVHPTSSSFLLMLFGRAVGEDLNLAISLLMVIGGVLSLLIRHHILNIATWLVLLMAP
jgi:hypothetical protein